MTRGEQPRHHGTLRSKLSQQFAELGALEDRGLLESLNGRIVVGWLVVEDLATVIVLVVLVRNVPPGLA
jgi:predicted Kef-type K+ transport protein